MKRSLLSLSLFTLAVFAMGYWLGKRNSTRTTAAAGTPIVSAQSRHSEDPLFKRSSPSGAPRQTAALENASTGAKPSLADIEAKLRTYKGGRWPADLSRMLDSVDPADISNLLAFVDQNVP